MKSFGIHVARKSQKVFLAALFFSLLVMGLYCYAFIKVFKKNEQIALLESQIKVRTEENNNLTSIKERIADTVSARAKLNSYFIPKDGVVPFLNGFESLAEENNLLLKVDSVAIEDEAAAPNLFEHVKLSAEVTGAWSDVYRFSKLIELMPLKVAVDMVDFEKILRQTEALTPKQKVPADPGWKGTFDIRVLKLK